MASSWLRPPSAIAVPDCLGPRTSPLRRPTRPRAHAPTRPLRFPLFSESVCDRGQGSCGLHLLCGSGLRDSLGCGRPQATRVPQSPPAGAGQAVTQKRSVWLPSEVKVRRKSPPLPSPRARWGLPGCAQTAEARVGDSGLAPTAASPATTVSATERSGQAGPAHLPSHRTTGPQARTRAESPHLPNPHRKWVMTSGHSALSLLALG